MRTFLQDASIACYTEHCTMLSSACLSVCLSVHPSVTCWYCVKTTWDRFTWFCQWYTKFDHGLSRLMATELHWLDVPERVKYKLRVLMDRCQHHQYLMDHCSPVFDVVFCQCLRSASSHQLSISRYRLSTYGRRAFSVSCWPDCLELIARRPSGSGVLCWQLQTVAEDISIFAVLVCSAQ